MMFPCCQYYLHRVKGARPLRVTGLSVPALRFHAPCAADAVEVEVEEVAVVVPPGEAVVDSMQQQLQPPYPHGRIRPLPDRPEHPPAVPTMTIIQHHMYRGHVLPCYQESA